MVSKKYIMYGLVFILVLGFAYSMWKRTDGFQNPVSNYDADIKMQMCSIFKETYNSLSVTLSKMDNSKVPTSEMMTAHLESIKQQMKEHRC
jgi:hypothetical protein